MTETNAPAAPAFDFKVEDAELPAITRSTETAGPNPFADVLRQSKEQGKGKAVTLPAAQVPTAVRFIRRAANDQEIGARIVLTAAKSGERLDTEMVGGTKTAKGRTSGGTMVVVKADGTRYHGNVKVLFQGQKRKAKKPTTTEPTTPATTG